MDALQSFTHLADNLPIWIAKLHEISRQVSERHAEFTRLSRASSASIRRKKTGSTESLRPNDTNISNLLETSENSAFLPLESTFSPLRIEVNSESKHLFQEYREEKLRRKRKSGSLLSNVSGAVPSSGALRLRSRMSVIVYYDSAIQGGFEMLVRNIASARNNLRKGRTQASFKARMASLGAEENPFTSSDGGVFGVRSPSVPRLPRSRSGQQYTLPGEGSTTEAFDVVDKELEAAQTLCEVGAHQFLRDGNCSEELGGTKERLDTCLRVAGRQARILKVEDEKEKASEEDERRRKAEARELSGGNGVIADEVGQFAVDGSDIKEGRIGISIEVDDASDTNEVHIDMSTFRATRRK